MRATEYLERSEAVLRRYREAGMPGLAAWVQATVAALRAGRKVLLFGNGGSAADAQHLAGEFVNRYLIHNRAALPAIALTTDTSVLTCIANDLGVEQLFARQVQALAAAGDVAVGISTSGVSVNVLEGLAEARARGCVTVGLTGAASERMAPLCDHLIAASDGLTPVIQQFHITVGHLWVDLVETEWEAAR
jgi:D-sedoheptulose 7-phosphate isomerase